jgi:hypothetical protein
MPFLHGMKDTVFRDDVVPRTRKGLMFRKRHRVKLKGGNEIRD